VQVLERDTHGRPTTCRIAYDDEHLHDVVAPEQDHVEMLLVWMPEAQGFMS